MCIARIFAIGIEHGDAADALRWHRQLVRWKWAYRKRGRGRPPLDVETVELITRLGRENPRWGCVRMQGELRKLGISRRCELDQTDPPPGRPRAGAPPDWSDVERIPQSAGQGVLACDFLTAETVFLKTVYVLFFIELATRRVHVAGATARPDSAWVTQHAGNLSVAGRLEDKHMLVRDRDAKFSGSFNEVFRTEGLRVLKTPVRAPRANAFAERWIGTLRRECVDHVLIFGRRHLQRVLHSYVDHYNRARPHRALELLPPDPKAGADPLIGSSIIRRRDKLGGLIHEYERNIE